MGGRQAALVDRCPCRIGLCHIARMQPGDDRSDRSAYSLATYVRYWYAGRKSARSASSTTTGTARPGLRARARNRRTATRQTAAGRRGRSAGFDRQRPGRPHVPAPCRTTNRARRSRSRSRAGPGPRAPKAAACRPSGRHGSRRYHPQHRIEGGRIRGQARRYNCFTLIWPVRSVRSAGAS